ncbi:hypothetical protein B0I35DRAFT_446962 [Stachybotrys elegans]|uniref:Uncharacterized protein n=1 Tax=Stachybotrys elegans TaxID=80388 RepID=A0A8K0SD82_9HYPO|nr:hypothetical protein B0I35DRAFT_446962 [Stachybotrys elegans]
MPIPHASSIAVSRDGFSFDKHGFYAVTPCGNQHLRAKPHQLSDFFSPHNKTSYPLHWFEAQLLHYGLPKADSKSVAMIRLWDAAKAHLLVVPDNIAKLKVQLKEEWTKKFDEARSDRSSGSKRKSKDDSAIAQKKQKKQKEKSSAAEPPVANAPAGTSTSKLPAPVAASPTNGSSGRSPKKQSKRPRAVEEFPSSIQPPPSTTGETPSLTHPASPAISIESDRSILLQDTPSAGSSRRTTHKHSRYLGDRPGGEGWGWPNNADAHPISSDDDDDGFSSDSDAELAPLGNISGDYSIRCPGVIDINHNYDDCDFEVRLKLKGSKLWGRFNLGLNDGILRFREAPSASSRDEVAFTWRGNEDNGPIVFGDDNTGYIKFLGGGRIHGQLNSSFGWVFKFRGQRESSDGTKDRLSYRKMIGEWNEYTEEEYERRRISRWG